MRSVGLVALGVLALTTLSAFLVPAVAQEHGVTLYLSGPAYPESVFHLEEPIADTLADLDRGRDPAPGLTLQPGGDPTRETDDALHQDFAVEVSGRILTSGSELELWIAAPESGEAVVTAHLLHCDRFGLDCQDLGGASGGLTMDAGTFERATLFIDIGAIEFGEDRTLVLSLTNGGGSPIWIGYDARTTPSSLRLGIEEPPPPTTTTTASANTTAIAAVNPPTPGVTVPDVTSPPPTVSPVTTTTTTHATTTTTTTTTTTRQNGVGSGATDTTIDEDVLTGFVFDYSMAAGRTETTFDVTPPDLVDRMVGGWGSFGTTMGLALPWLAALAVFGAGTAYTATRRRAS